MNITETLERRARVVARSARDRAHRAVRPPVPSVYANILDGATLWLALDATEGTLELRHHGSGKVHELASDLTELEDGRLSFRADLHSVVADQCATYDVELAPPGGGRPRPVDTPKLPTLPTIPPPVGDGRTQINLVRGSGGRLQVRVSRIPESAELRSLSPVPGGVEVILTEVPEGAGLLLRSDEGEVRARYPLTVADGVGRAVVTVDRLPTSGPVYSKWVVGDDEHFLMIRRRANGLRDPNEGVLLPELFWETSDVPIARFRWSPAGLLAMRLIFLEPDFDAEGTEPVT